MTLIAFLDETGDPALEKIDPDFPVFVLSLFVCRDNEYIATIVPSVQRLKRDTCGSDDVILHSRDIRRHSGDFACLKNPDARAKFYDDLNVVMSQSPYSLVVGAIHKGRHKAQYGRHAIDPYTLALTFTLERLLGELESRRQTALHIVAEARGEREDDELRLAFLQLTSYGTQYVSAERFRAVTFTLEFRAKRLNVVGTQLADLAGYPIARRVLAPSAANPAFDIVAPKFLRDRNGVPIGLKQFP